MNWTGGCLCGAVHYNFEGDPLWKCHCHCSMCRRLTGAGFATWVGFPAGAFSWTKGQPSFYRSSSEVEIGFCQNCSGTMTFHRVHEASAALGSLDHPEIVPAGSDDDHVWVEDQIPWLKIDDNLPRYEQFTPGLEDERDALPRMGDNPAHRDDK